MTTEHKTFVLLAISFSLLNCGGGGTSNSTGNTGSSSSSGSSSTSSGGTSLPPPNNASSQNTDDTTDGANLLFVNQAEEGELSLSDDSDYYIFSSSQNGSFQIELSDYGTSDLDIFFYDADGNIIDSSVDIDTTETIYFEGIQNAWYYVQVSEYDLTNATQSYQLEVRSLSSSPPPNNPSSSNTTGTAKGTINWTLTDACNDGYLIRLRFHEVLNGQRTNWLWPGGTQYYQLSGTQSYRLTCSVGTQVCYGAENGDNSGSTWGIGLDGTQSCEDCCYTCETGTVTSQSRSLICN